MTSLPIPPSETRLLLAHALGVQVEEVLALPYIPAERQAYYESLLTRRAAGEPMAYILGMKEFWSLEFEVTPATLIPRPDTETVMEALLAHFPDRAAPLHLLDAGTGSGCILIAALSEYPNARGVGIDISAEALEVASRNAARLGVAGRTSFVQMSFEGLLCHDIPQDLSPRTRPGVSCHTRIQETPGRVRGDRFGVRQFDALLANPPYIPTHEIQSLMGDVRDYEPHSALDGGENGLNPYVLLAKAAKYQVRQGGKMVFEAGFGQHSDVKTIGEAAGLRFIEHRNDLSGIPRVTVFESPSYCTITDKEYPS